MCSSASRATDVSTGEGAVADDDDALGEAENSDGPGVASFWSRSPTFEGETLSAMAGSGRSSLAVCGKKGNGLVCLSQQRMVSESCTSARRDAHWSSAKASLGSARPPACPQDAMRWTTRSLIVVHAGGERPQVAQHYDQSTYGSPASAVNSRHMVLRPKFNFALDVWIEAAPSSWIEGPCNCIEYI